MIDGTPSDPAHPALVYRDDWLVAIFKPAGMLVHRSDVDRRERRVALQWTRDRLGRTVYPVHRLDKPTAGLLLFALDPATAAAMERQFSGGAVCKRYLAVVRGFVGDQGRIDHPLGPRPDRGDGRSGDLPRPAVTDYRCLARVELPLAVRPYASSRYSLLELRPRQGRMHQIRRHLKHVFHPIVGDTTYGDGHHNRAFRSRFDCRRLMLVATALDFGHPHHDRRVQLDIGPDAEFRRVLSACGLSAGDCADSR